MSRWIAWPSTTSTMHAKRALSQNGTRRRGLVVAADVGGGASLVIAPYATDERMADERSARIGNGFALPAFHQVHSDA
ncbi:hypothetical protein GCM10022219_00460 [Microbacterium oryzae]